MDATALCIRLLMDVLVLLVAQVDHSSFARKPYAARPSVSPDRLQFFEYDTVSVSCEEFTGLTEWRVMRKLDKKMHPDSNNWNSSTPSYTIDASFARDSGEYWCEDAEGHRSGAVNIIVTAGSVILDVPARPVVEGHDVTLHCRRRNSQSKQTAEFYKDGLDLGTQNVGNLTLHNVSKSDEGLYKCRIPGAGQSPQSWLAVVNQSKEANDDTPTSFCHSSNLLSLLWIVGLVVLQLVVMGQLLC